VVVVAIRVAVVVVVEMATGTPAVAAVAAGHRTVPENLATIVSTTVLTVSPATVGLGH
jgi:hypothetical protein